MKQTINMNLPLAGRIQHGEKQTNGKKQKIVDYGYFIAKVKDETLSFLKNRFNEKYPQSKMLHIRFFTENPLIIRNARYNQSGLVCYCGYNQSEGKQKNEGKWTPIKCSEECQYRIAEENKRPACSCEGNLKFLLPDISMDRIWTMKITGYTSIFRLKEYIEFQKYLGNSIIGDYYLFLKKETQTNRESKSFENFILDIVRKEEVDSNSSNQKQEQVSTNTQKIVDKPIQNSKPKENISAKTDKKVSEPVINTVNVPNNNKDTVEKKVATTNAVTVTENKTNDVKTQNSQHTTDDPFKNYYVLVESFERELQKDGKPTKYQFATFVDQDNKTIDAVISPKFINELSECDTGTTVILDIQTAGKLIIANDIKFVQKCPKNIAA